MIGLNRVRGAQVRRLVAAPAELGELAASAGDDGAVCLLSLPAGACARALPGPPGAAPARLAWAPALGYLAALYARAGDADASAVGLVWDLHSGAPGWACGCSWPQQCSL